MRAYPEVSTLSQKQIHFFVIGHCCPLGSSFLLSLCSTCSVSSTIRSIPDTDLLAPHVGHLVAAVWFSGSTKKLTGHKFRRLIRVTARNCWCSCLLVGNSINFPEACHILKTAIQITWHVAYKRPNLSVISKVVVPSTSVHWWFCNLSPCFHLWPVEDQPECSKSVNCFLVWLKKTTQESVFSTWHWHWKLFWEFNPFPLMFMWVWGKTVQVCLFLHTHTKHWTPTKKQHRPVAAKVTGLTKEGNDTMMSRD